MKNMFRILHKVLSSPLELWLVPDYDNGEKILPWSIIVAAWTFLIVVGIMSSLEGTF